MSVGAACHPSTSDMHCRSSKKAVMLYEGMWWYGEGTCVGTSRIILN